MSYKSLQATGPALASASAAHSRARVCFVVQPGGAVDMLCGAALRRDLRAYHREVRNPTQMLEPQFTNCTGGCVCELSVSCACAAP
jgi:hypothetical protein